MVMLQGLQQLCLVVSTPNLTRFCTSRLGPGTGRHQASNYKCSKCVWDGQIAIGCWEKDVNGRLSASLSGFRMEQENDARVNGFKGSEPQTQHPEVFLLCLVMSIYDY